MNKIYRAGTWIQMLNTHNILKQIYEKFEHRRDCMWKAAKELRCVNRFKKGMRNYMRKKGQNFHERLEHHARL